MINDINKRVLIWRFTLVLIKINYGQIGDQTVLFYTTNPVFYTSGNIFVRRTGMFTLGIRFFHLFRRTTVIQDLLVRCQFSLVPDNRTNVNVEACPGFLVGPVLLIFSFFVVVILFVFTFWVSWCDVRYDFCIKNDVRFIFTSSCL
jgi:hypothetical protein